MAEEGDTGRMGDGGVKDMEGPPGVDEKPEEVSEEDRLWQVVQENPIHFSAWTQLLGLAEKSDSEEFMRKCFEGFLAEFPLCYGYWKKYADCVKRITEDAGLVTEIFERGVSAVPVSVDLWIQYIDHAAEVGKDAEFLRGLYKRAVNDAGTDYHSGPLWDKYIEFEASLSGPSDQSRIGAIYNLILGIPTIKNIAGYYSQYQTWRQRRPPTEWIPVDDIASLVGDGAEAKTPKEVEAAVREEATKRVDAIYAKTSVEAESRAIYEAGIKRPYFHVESLDVYELQNWRDYLDFEEREGTYQSTVALYERCVVTTCLYAEFWVRYAKYVERSSEGGPEAARGVLTQAAWIYCKRGVAVHSELAAFEEQQGNLDASRKALMAAIEISPRMIQPRLRFAQFERRCGNLSAAGEVYEAAIDATEEDASEDKKSLVFLFMHYARFTSTFLRNVDKTRELYYRGIERCPKSKLLYAALVSYELAVNAEDMFDNVVAVYEKVISEECKLSEVEKLDLFQSYSDFAADFAPNITITKQVADRYQAALTKRAQERKSMVVSGGSSKASKSANGYGGAQVTSY